MLTELFGLHPVCLHETDPVTIFHVTFYLPGWVCAVLQIVHTSVAGFSSRITKVTTISVEVGFVVERVTLVLPPPIIPFAPLSIIPQLISVTFDPLNTKAIQPNDYTTSFLSHVCVSFIQFLWRHRTPDWCRSQLLCLVIRRLDKIYEITVLKDAYSVAHLVATLPYKSECRGFDSR